MGDRFYWFVAGALAVWRVTHLLSAEDGPWKLMARGRRFLGQNFRGGLLDCFYCLSIWVAIPFAFWLIGDWRARWSEGLLLVPALSGAAIMMERLTADRQAVFIEDPESAEREGGKR